MALIECPECGELISEKAAKCPHCGITKKKIKKERYQDKYGFPLDLLTLSIMSFVVLYCDFSGDPLPYWLYCYGHIFGIFCIVLIVVYIGVVRGKSTSKKFRKVCRIIVSILFLILYSGAFGWI